MGASSGLALKFIQWFIRGIQFLCCAVVLGIFSYFLAALANHHLTIDNWVRAVEGISGAGVLYTLIGLLLLCCLAGHPATSFIAIVLDIAFIACFIYVAVSVKAGASSCTGTVYTPFGSGNAADTPTGNTGGFTNLPRYRTACRMETACLAVSIVAIIFFVLSILVELVLVRHRRKESRFGPSPANDYTSGSGPRNKFMGMFRRRGTTKTENPNALPEHTTPSQVRQSYNTESTAIGHEPATHNKYGESGYHNTEAGYHHDGQTAFPEQHGITNGHTSQPAGYRYNDGTYAA
ncbi:hypothetical protein BJ170DRAFT_618150 [Xylariales sp. AK1849]|nr:hypothetical protein BJ170DRAFT_618150 [Xylariales sp. AK1849]